MKTGRRSPPNMVLKKAPQLPSKKQQHHHLRATPEEVAHIDALLSSSAGTDTVEAMKVAAVSSSDKPTVNAPAKTTSNKKKLQWKNDLYVVKPTPTQNDDFRPRRRSLLADSSSLKQPSTRIEDPEKLNSRWEWYQQHIGNAFKPYKTMLSKADATFFSPSDDNSVLQGDMSEYDEHHVTVRNAMLDDGELSEREIAAFFEAFHFVGIKVKSLESQLELAKKLHERSPIRKMSSVVPSGKGTLRIREPTPLAQKSKTSSAFKSLRTMSIVKLRHENKDKEVDRLLQELEEADAKQKKLEKQLQQAGIKIAEDIPYEEAKAQVEKIAKRMAELGTSDGQEYFRLEQDMERYHTALTLTDEWIKEQEENARKWEEDNAEENMEALKMIRRHLPVDIKCLSEAQLATNKTANGRVLPKALAKRFKRTNVLQILRVNPEDLVKVHPASVENLRVAGLTLTERRAIHAHLQDVAPRWKSLSAEPLTERKWNWYMVMKQNFEESLGAYNRHVAQYGLPGNHPYATRDDPSKGCPLIGKQCPLKANAMVDYSGDYGYTDDAIYEESNVKKADKEDPGAKAIREARELTRDKKSNERAEGVRQHYKGNILQVSLAMGSCENMDDVLDRLEGLWRRWIEERLSNIDASDSNSQKELAAFRVALNEVKLALLSFAERSGMQLTGKKDANACQPDIRSPIEIGLSEEVCEACIDFFEDIIDRMRAIEATDGRLKSTINQLRELLDELHERNVATLKRLNVDRPPRSKKATSPSDIKREIRKTLRSKETTSQTSKDNSDKSSNISATAQRGHGGLMTAIAGRGAGPTDLMAALKSRGEETRQGAGPKAIAGGAAGPPDLMAAIKNRQGAGPPNLMAAIKNRGEGTRAGLQNDPARAANREKRPPSGGHGDLMAAIAARSSGSNG